LKSEQVKKQSSKKVWLSMLNQTFLLLCF